MTVSNGQLANQTTFNNAFLSRLQDTSTIGTVDLLKVDLVSGASVFNVQRELNSLNSFTGHIGGSVYNVLPVWLSNELGMSTDNLQQRIEAIDAEFDETTGHTHDGSPGNGGPISAADLTNLNFYTAEYQYLETMGVTGSTWDVSTDFGSKSPGGTPTAEGVITSPPDNQVSLIDLANGGEIEDAQGQRVYGRITEAAGVWTLSFYTNEAGVETASTIVSSTDIAMYFKEVFTLFTKPTITADIGFNASLDLTRDVNDASPTLRGVVNTTAQSFAGDKTFQDFVKLEGELHFDMVTDSASGSNATLSLPTKTIVRLTNGSLVSIEGITAPAHQQVVAVFNLTGVELIILDDQGATTANRILTGTQSDFTFLIDAAILLIYDSTSQRWRMLGGGGSGSAPLRLVSTFSGTSVTPTDEGDETFLYTGGSAQTFDANGFGTLSLLTEGKRITLMGSDDTDTLYLTESDASDGYLMNGDCTLYRGSTIEFEYNATLARMVEVARS